MRQLLERPVSVRLSASTYQRYEAAAAERGMSLFAYLRERLEVDDQIAEHISQLRLTLMDTPRVDPPASLKVSIKRHFA